jgi:hypothetical protein
MRNLFVAAVLVTAMISATASASDADPDLAGNAVGVLLYIGGDLQRVEGICDGDAGTPVLEAVAAIDAALTAVAAVLDPYLMPARNACLSALGAARVSILVEAA